MNNETRLPQDFADLEKYVAPWAHASEAQRSSARLSSTMDEIREFYSAMLLRVSDALNYLDQFPLNDMPDREQTLMNLCLGLVEVGNAVDYYNQPQVKGGAGGAGFDHAKLFKEKLYFTPKKCVRTTP
jgi:hypothetical protein